MRVNTELSPHQVCCKGHLALLASVNVVLVRPEVTLAHQFGARIAGNFGEWGLFLVPSLSVSPADLVHKVIIVIVIVFFLVLSEVGSPSIGMEDML